MRLRGALGRAALATALVTVLATAPGALPGAQEPAGTPAPRAGEAPAGTRPTSSATGSAVGLGTGSATRRGTDALADHPGFVRAAASRAGGAPDGGGAGPGASSGTPAPAAAVPGARRPAPTGPAAPAARPATGDPAAGAVTAGGAPQPDPASPLSPAATPPAPEPVPAPGEVRGTIQHVWAHHVVGAVTGPATGPDEGHAPGEAHPAATLSAWLATGSAAYRLAPGPLTAAAPGSAVTATLGAPDAAGAHPVTAVTALDAPAPAQVDGVAIGADTLLDFDALPSAVTHEVTVVLATPPGASPDSTTPTAVGDRVAGPVAAYWAGASRGQRSVVVTGTHSWVSLTTPCSRPFDLWNEVASRVGWTPGTRKHLLVYLPAAAGCGAGLGTVGSSESGGRMWVSHNATDVIAHELGHNLGLGHSNGLLCPSTGDGAYAGGWSEGCTVHGYRDYYDVMGISWGTLGSLAAPHADRLGLLSSSSKATVTSPGRWRLAPVSGSGLRVLKIDDPGGTYYVEYRPAVAEDAWLRGNWRGLDPGVLVRRVNPADGRESLLLDGSVTGGTRTSDWAAALTAGAVLRTASGRHAVTVEQADDGGATVSVAVDGQGAPPPAPPPTDGSQVVLASPADGARVPAGVTTFSGTATAPEGTVLWEVREGGTVRAAGSAAAGSNGAFDAFSFPVSLPPGTYAVRVWVPDESDAEGGRLAGPGFSRTVTVTVA